MQVKARAGGGRKSKSKGYRGEILLRDYLRKCGWTADRVPMSGAIASLPGDVRAEKGTRKLLFEVKNRADFAQVYALYEQHCKTMHDDVLAFVALGEKYLCVSASTSLDALFDGPDHYSFVDRHPLHSEFGRTFQKIGRMQELLGKADILAIRGSHKPFIFVRYR